MTLDELSKWLDDLDSTDMSVMVTRGEMVTVLVDHLPKLINVAKTSTRLRDVGGNFDEAQHRAEVAWFAALIDLERM